MLKFERMTEEEQGFVRMYAQALVRDGDVMMTAAHLMTDESLAISDFYSAVCVAQSFENFSCGFGAAVDAPEESSSPFRWTPAEQEKIVNFFQLSFFNLLAGESFASVNAGWFSGTPEEWTSVITAIDSLYKEQKKNYNNPLGNLFDAFSSLQSKAAIKSWPPVGEFNEQDWYYDPDADDSEWGDEIDDDEF
jgi:hypothetical protein